MELTNKQQELVRQIQWENSDIARIAETRMNQLANGLSDLHERGIIGCLPITEESYHYVTVISGWVVFLEHTDGYHTFGCFMPVEFLTMSEVMWQETIAQGYLLNNSYDYLNTIDVDRVGSEEVDRIFTH